MLRMVGLLILVLIGAQLAADPRMWSWMFPQDAQTEQKTQTKEIDYGVKFEEEDSPLPPDVFRSKPEDAEPPSAHPPAVAEAAPKRLSSRPGPVEETSPKPAKVAEDSIEIDPELLAPITDGWFGIRKHEAPAFYKIIAKARDIPLTKLEKTGDPKVDYTVLMLDSVQFRGRLLTVEGTIRMIESVSVAGDPIATEQGLDHYYVAWMWTESSGNSPYRLIATSLPEDMPPGRDLEIPAKFTGYFFKKEGYKTGAGFHVAPVLIGKHIRSNRPAAVAPGTDDLGFVPYVAGLAVLIALGLGIMIWRFGVSDKKFGHKHFEHYTAADPNSLKELSRRETHDPQEFFRQIEEQAKTEESENQAP